MRTLRRRAVPLALIVLLVPACSSGGGGGGGGGGGTNPPPPATNQPPGVVLLRPTSPAAFNAGDPIVVEADITDSDGFVTQVAFFQGSTLLSTIAGFPFRFTWTGAAPGTYSLTAVATDNLGAQTTSLPVTVTIAGGASTNRPPAVAITSPPDGSSFPVGYPATIEADATDPDGVVRRVEFFDGTTSLGSAAASPWRIAWTAAPEGSHSLRAVATDSSGASTSSSSVAVTVTPAGGASGPTGSLRGVFFADASTGWIAGEGGQIFKTTNGGASWTAQSSGTTGILSRLQFLNANLGWIVGEAGVILKTVDGGSRWMPQTSGTTAFLNGLSFVSATTGWVVGEGGVVLRTTDGGTTWTSLPSGTTESLGAVSFVSTSVGFVAGFTEILSTVDGGTTWSRQSTDFIAPSGMPATAHFLDGRFMSGAHGTIVGNARTGDVLWTTTDGGATWTRRNTNAPPYTMNGVAFGDALSLVAVGTWGGIATSVDGGQTWTVQAPPTGEILRGVWMVSALDGWAVGENGTVLRTTDGGVTWVDLTGT